MCRSSQSYPNGILVRGTRERWKKWRRHSNFCQTRWSSRPNGGQTTHLCKNWKKIGRSRESGPQVPSFFGRGGLFSFFLVLFREKKGCHAPLPNSLPPPV